MSADKVAALEGLLTKVQSRRLEAPTRLRLAFDAAAGATAEPSAAPKPVAPASAVAQPGPSPSTQRLGGAVGQSPPRPTTPETPPESVGISVPEARASEVPEIVMDDAELGELTPEEAAELAALDAEGADIEIIEDEVEPETARVQEEPAASVEPPTAPRPDLAIGPSSDVVTGPLPIPEEEDDDFHNRVTGRPPPPMPIEPAQAEAEAPRPQGPPPLPDQAAGEVRVEPPPSPEPAPTLQVGDMVVKPRRVEPQILLEANVGDFVTEVQRVAPATFGEVVDASLELGD